MTHDFQARSCFQPHQIVYLACDQSRLYTEVIEILAERQLAWVRPLALVTPQELLPLAAAAALGWGAAQPWHDQATIPDLLWPLDQFFPALDTDFVDLLAMMPAHPDQQGGLSQGAIVAQFTRRLWEIAQGNSQPHVKD